MALTPHADPLGTAAELVGALEDSLGTAAYQDSTAFAAAGHDHSGVYQPLDSDLTAIAALTTSAYGRSLLESADAAAARTSLGAGTIGGSTGATDNRILRSDGTGGSTVQASAASLGDAGNLILPSGDHTRMAVGFGDDFTGFYRSGNFIYSRIGNQFAVAFAISHSTSVGLVLASGNNGVCTGGISFMPVQTLSGTSDSGISRVGPGIIRITDGTTSGRSGLELRDVRLQAYTDATLPTVGVAGRVAYSSDSGLVYDDGANWKKTTWSNI